ncbi:hypothetical protein JHK84_027364 [Glycine max]|nr:hypothetical protein JHK84_027364 [Glycine max]
MAMQYGSKTFIAKLSSSPLKGLCMCLRLGYLVMHTWVQVSTPQHRTSQHLRSSKPKRVRIVVMMILQLEQECLDVYKRKVE